MASTGDRRLDREGGTEREVRGIHAVYDDVVLVGARASRRAVAGAVQVDRAGAARRGAIRGLRADDAYFQSQQVAGIVSEFIRQVGDRVHVQVIADRGVGRVEGDRTFGRDLYLRTDRAPAYPT